MVACCEIGKNCSPRAKYTVSPLGVNDTRYSSSPDEITPGSNSVGRATGPPGASAASRLGGAADGAGAAASRQAAASRATARARRARRAGGRCMAGSGRCGAPCSSS